MPLTGTFQPPVIIAPDILSPAGPMPTVHGGAVRSEFTRIGVRAVAEAVGVS